jgi:CRP/FNR family transcriptional regulator, cyclic AMP receptor protein
MAGAEQLASFRPFDRLRPEHRTLISRIAREVTFAAGATLFREGEPAAGCWLIRSGQVALGTAVPARGHVVVQTLGPGEVLGWSWLVPPHYWHFTATASTDVSAVELDTAQLRALADADPELGYPLSLGLFEVVVSRLQSTRSRLLDLYGSPRDR